MSFQQRIKDTYDGWPNQARIEAIAAEADKRIRDLEALATVYDVTVAVLVAVAGGIDSLDEIAKSQVEAARSACLEITGEPSMVGFSRFNNTENGNVANVDN